METVDLVGQIYESIGDSEALEKTLIQIAQFADSRATQLGVIDKMGNWPIAMMVGMDPNVLQAYIKQYAVDDPRMVFSRRNPGRLVACHQILNDPVAFDSSSLVNDLLEKAEARFAMAAMLPIDPNHSAILCMMRARRDGQYSDDQLSRVARLLPHVRRALGHHIRLGRLESQLTSISALVDRLVAPVLLVDRTGLLRYTNSSGQEALRRADFLVLRTGRVQPRSVKQERHFTDVLAAALSDDVSTAATELSSSIRLLDGEGHAAVLIVQALRGQANLSGMPQAHAVLFLIRADEKPSVNTTRLQMVFGLTPAETRLAEHLVSGKDLRQIGEELKVSRETLKSQLRSLFTKTDTRRQGELIARLLSSILVSITPAHNSTQPRRFT